MSNISLDCEYVRSADPNSRRLMVVLHGLGDSMDGYRWLPGQMNLPWLNYLLVNAPDDYFGGFSWYDLDGDPAPGIARSYTLLHALLDQQSLLGYPTNQTVLLGFSQGCLMTIESGLRYPAKFAGLVGISGYVHEPERLLRQASNQAGHQNFLITHGTQDPLIPIQPVREQMNLLRKAGIQITWQEYPKVHTISNGAELAEIRKFVSNCFV